MAAPGPAPALVRALGAAVRGEVRFDPAERAVYGQDASNYRQVPRGVVRPVDVDDVRAAVAVCREFGAPVVARGAGTSIGGQAIGPDAVVLDFRRYLGRVLEVDPQARTARVEPGTVLDELQRAARPFGLRFGPDPSTHSRCTLGGMIGNDACGSHSLAWGRTSDNVHALDLLLADGAELTVTGPLPPAERAALAAAPGRLGVLHRELQALAADNLALLRRAMPVLPRRGSGYPLDALLPERGYDLVRAVTGTEGTCALLLGATVRLVPEPAARALVVAGYPDETAAADAVPALLPLEPLTCEGMAADLVAALLASGPRPRVLDRLPDGACWLFLETGGDTPAAAADRARELADAVRRERAATVAVVTDPGEQRALWSIREAGAGIVTRLPPGPDGRPGGAAWPGWEDSAVPVEQLGSYLRQLRALLGRHGLRGVPFGHFGEGCVHLRLDFPLSSPPGSPPNSPSPERPQAFREFMLEAADLVVAHGGSLSGEHGDGQARAELLPRMFPAEVIDLFARFKRIWDPGGLLSPGLLVEPRPLDADLRFPGRELPLTLAYPQDGGSLLSAVHRCVGVGKCVDTTAGAGVMCPSYQVTREERHSTRGRARLLGEMLRGDLVTGGWRSPEVREALDLCLGCKGCASDCPVHVDMATYRSEFLYHHYRFRPRPAAHLSLGWLPAWLRLAHLAPRAANAALRGRLSGALLKRLGGIDARRALPALPERRFSAWFRAHRAAHPVDEGAPAVLLWPDSMSELLDPAPAQAAVRVLERLGFRVVLPPGPVCCGLTLIAGGQLGAARRVVRHSLRRLGRLPSGLPVVGLEPSCTATLRADWPRLLGGERPELLDRVRTLAEFLDEREVPLPHLGGTAITQVHCHQHAVLGTEADRRTTARLGLTDRQLPSGCCGLAGAFGFERGHYDLSVTLAERTLLPAVRAAGPDTLLLADGLSCRTQVSQLEPSARPLHLAEVLLRAFEQSDRTEGPTHSRG